MRGRRTEKTQRCYQARAVASQKLPVSTPVRGIPEAGDISYKAQMVEFECCVGPWIKETFAGILAIGGAADEGDFTDY